MNKSEFSVKIREKTLKVRKWKVKDRNAFLLCDSSDITGIQEALVYNCILSDDKIALSDEEYKYVLCKIREKSIKTPIVYDMECSECKHEFEYNCVLTDVMKPVFKQYGLIKNFTDSFLMGSIRNRDFYNQKMLNATDAERDYFDFILHIQSYNNNDAMTFDDIVQCINDLDVDAFENIFNEWNKMKFKIDNVHSVECPECEFSELYEFDDLPDFFPESWVK